MNRMSSRLLPCSLLAAGLCAVVLQAPAHAQPMAAASAPSGAHGMSHDMQGMHGMHVMPSAKAATAPKPAAVDTRQVVSFPPRYKRETLREMREHLAAVSDIQAALSKSEYELAARIADSRLGLSSTQHGDMMASARYMPAGMRELGYAMHQSASQFAVVAQDASVTGDVRPALAALAKITQNCVACHAAYKLK